MLFWAPDFPVLLSGRIVSGIGSGLCTPASFLALSEIALIRYRGKGGSINVSADTGWRNVRENVTVGGIFMRM